MLLTEKESLRQTGREYWVDFLKGIAIILVVLGHCDLPAFLINTVYLFHMPLFLTGSALICLGFMIVVGCLYGRRRFKPMEYIGQQSLTVMVAHLYILSVLMVLGDKIVPGVSPWIYFLLTTAMSVFAAFIVEKKLPFLNDFRYVKKIKCK